MTLSLKSQINTKGRNYISGSVKYKSINVFFFGDRETKVTEFGVIWGKCLAFFLFVLCTNI